jgi:type VI secretion system protein ImpF
VRRTIERAISLFEPRLEDVMVILIPGNSGEQIMRFRIDARLKVEPAPEPVTFDTLLQLDNGQYVVNEQR